MRSLAHAELSTCSRSPNVVPRLISLAHQFNFYTLGEDYHALIRRNQLDIPGTKMDVRKERRLLTSSSRMLRSNSRVTRASMSS
ncbi:hypothetical protein BDR06DRAFT_1037767 [Suillus hirtellus]|nr:hypothetical protein BDR06DRAFT_1037767 [Suillus hirtellus]